MGAKIILSFLLNDSMEDIILKAIHLLNRNGWEYNKYLLGEYTYWINGPIWELGKSKTVTESKLDNNFPIENIVHELKDKFSPSLELGLSWYAKKIRGILSIIEGKGKWKELNFSVDRYEILDSFIDNDTKNKSKEHLLIIFKQISLTMRPYYSIGATECNGVGKSPLDISKGLLLGDFNYFSNAAIQIIQLTHNDISKYEIMRDGDGGIFYFIKDDLLFEY